MHFFSFDIKICLNESNASYIFCWKNMLRNINVVNREVLFSLLLSLLYKYWKNIFYGWNMALYFFHRYIWEVCCNSPILLLFDMFVLPFSWSIKKEKKVILLMGILMVAMTVSNREIARSNHYNDVVKGYINYALFLIVHFSGRKKIIWHLSFPKT